MGPYASVNIIQYLSGVFMVQGKELRESARFRSAIPVTTEAGKGISCDVGNPLIYFENVPEEIKDNLLPD